MIVYPIIKLYIGDGVFLGLPRWSSQFSSQKIVGYTWLYIPLSHQLIMTEYGFV